MDQEVDIGRHAYKRAVQLPASVGSGAERLGGGRIPLGGRSTFLHAAFLAAAVSAAPAALGQVAAAGAAASAPNIVVKEAVAVTGARAATETAQNIKRNAEQILDSTVAEDVGKFPDSSVAEALARVTGIQIRRDSGEANSVLIRGLPNVSTLLNGRELFTTTGRFVQLADVPATMLRRVDVYKSQSAEQIEGAIAGVIDVRTNRPFDFAATTLSFSSRATYADKSGSVDPSVSGMVSSRWQTGMGEFGALLGMSVVQRNFHEERAFNTAPEDKTSSIPAFGGTAQTATGPFVMGLIPIAGDRRRNAVNAALQWRPNSAVELYAEAFASELRNNFEVDFFVGLPWLSDTSRNVVTLIPGTNQVQTLSSHDVFTITSTQANRQSMLTDQFAVGGHWDVTPRLRLKSEIATTASRFDWQNPILDISLVVPNVLVDTSRGGTPHLEYTGVDMRDPGKYNLQGFFDRFGKDRGKSTEWRGDFEFSPGDGGPLRQWQGGVRVSRRSAESIKSYEGNAAAPAGIGVASIPGLGCHSEPMAGGGPDYGMTQWATPCAGFLLNDTAVIRTAITGSATPRSLDPGSFFKDIESTYAAYAKAHFFMTMVDIPVDGGLGVRIVRTQQDVQGNSSTGGVYELTTKSSAYTDVLPSLNLRFTLRPDLLARLAVGKTITRPNFSDLNPGVAFVAPSVTVKGSGVGGNPDLQSVKSTNLDASLEWYLGRAGSVHATVFHHRFKGYILQRTTVETFNGTPFDITRPYNSDDGTLKGFEVGGQKFFDGLPGWLNGLGMQANFTYTDGKTTSSGATFVTPGLSRTSYNLIGLYERSGWSARLAYNWRSGFVDMYDQGGPGLDLKVRPTSQLDGSVSYQISKVATLVMEATNLLDTKFQDYWKDPAVYPRDTRRYDRTIGVGIIFRL